MISSSWFVEFFSSRSLNEALNFLSQTESFRTALYCNIYRFLFRRCGETHSIFLGRQIHAHLVKTTTIVDTSTSNTQLTMYSRCGELLDARRLFDKMPHRDIATWNSIIAGYIDQECIREAWILLKHMRRDGFRFDEFTFGSILKSSGGAGDVRFGQQIHSIVVRTGFQSNVFSSSALVYMYAKCGRMKDAETIFASMSLRNSVSWNTMLSGYIENFEGGKAWNFFVGMEREGIVPDQATLATLLSYTGGVDLLVVVRQLHGKIVKHGFLFDVVVGNAAITAYSECYSIQDAKLLFKEMKIRDLVTWNAILAGYVHNDQSVEAVGVFREMQFADVKLDTYTFTTLINACCRFENVWWGKLSHSLAIQVGLENRTPVSNALIGIYSTFNCMDDAFKLFKGMHLKDVVSWNSILAGYSQNGFTEEAMKVYSEMSFHNVKLDQYTFSSVLRCCANLATLQLGKQIHCSTIKGGFRRHMFVGSALIYMYSRCGVIEDASRSFDETSKEGSVTWNSIIFAHAQHGQGQAALYLFNLMQEIGVKPDHITFVGILSACSHVGLVEEGAHFLRSMDTIYGVQPRMEHFACAVDLFGRAGMLDRAKSVIESMPFKPNGMVWKTLLGACRVHRDMGLAKYVAQFLLELEPEEHSTYVLLSNLYASQGEWDCQAKLKRTMRDKGLRKVAGVSWVELKNKVHSFNAEDRSHPQLKEIYEKIEMLLEQIKGMGYVPDTEFVFHNLAEDVKEKNLSYHSEKLALAFAIMNIQSGDIIRIMKNLRTCGDCHTAFKFISKAIDRDIVMRDANRFHHFKSGICSCGDYW